MHAIFVNSCIRGMMRRRDMPLVSVMYHNGYSQSTTRCSLCPPYRWREWPKMVPSTRGRKKRRKRLVRKYDGTVQSTCTFVLLFTLLVSSFCIHVPVSVGKTWCTSGPSHVRSVTDGAQYTMYMTRLDLLLQEQSGACVPSTAVHEEYVRQKLTMLHQCRILGGQLIWPFPK